MRLAFLLLLLLVAGTARAAGGAPRCDGRFVVEGSSLLGGDGVTAIEVDGRRVSILDACAPTRLRLRRRGDSLELRARWRQCGADVARVKLRALVDRATCRSMRGTLGTRTPASSRPFVASRATRVLVFSRTAGFRHASIADAVRVLGSLPVEERIVPSFTEDPAAFTDEGLAAYDVVVFVNTTGDVLDDDQQGAMERFIRSGRGYVGVHSAADTEYDWPWYGRLVGAYFMSHPILPVTVEVTTEDNTHPSTAHLPPTFSFTDEIYNFDRNPRADNAILLTIDEAGFTFPNFPGGPSMGIDHPVAWYKEYDGGRSFYTNLGHRPVTWDDPAFRQHLFAGIRWAGGPITYSRIVLTGEASNPLALAVAPDGRVFYIERTGELRVWQPATGRVLEAARLDVDTTQENGLLGLTLDPGFATNRFIYLYYSAPVSDPPPVTGPPGENVLSRFVVRADGTLDERSRVDILRVPSERACCHEGGALAFAPDGTLFLSTGDNTNPFGDADGRAPLDERPGREQFNSQRTAGNPFDLRGKILRIRPDGSIPPGNLFPASGEAGRPEIYVMGVRNPFRTAVDPATGRLFWGDVGPDGVADSPRGPRGYDEINFADSPGRYGWPFCIAGNVPYPDYDFATGIPGPLFSCDGFRPALLAYDYLTLGYRALGTALDPERGLTGRTAIAGVFYRTPGGEAPFALPAPYRDTLLMTDWTRDVIAAVDVTAAGTLGSLRRLIPWERFLRPIDLDVGPDGALYVLEYGSGYGGDNVDARVSRVEYSAAGALSPVAAIDASPTAGAPPLTVVFSAERSRAPGSGDRVVRWAWDFDGDGRIDATGPRVRRTFRKAGRFPVTLTVVGVSGRRSLPASVEIAVGNSAPTVRIVSPVDGARVTDGQVVTLEGEATDAEDGTVSCDDLTWDIRLGHNAHAHPFVARTGCTAQFTARLPGHGSGDLFFAIELAYTDRGAPGGVPPLTGRAAVRIDVGPRPPGSVSGAFLD